MTAKRPKWEKDLERKEGITFRGHKKAFDEAIKKGWLSTNPKDDHYAGNYMYMHTKNRGGRARQKFDCFKHIDTREYLIVPPWERPW